MKNSEIWLVNLDPIKGSELKKQGPVIINSDGVGILPLNILVLLTDWKYRYDLSDWMVKVDVDNENNLLKTSAADCFQVRSVDQSRLRRKTGELKEHYMGEIRNALALILDIDADDVNNE